MSLPISAKKTVVQWGVQNLPRFAGWFTFFSGLLVIVSWYARGLPVLPVLPNTQSMPFNTALGFVFSSAGLLLLIWSNSKIAAGLGAITFLFTLATLSQYILGWNLGIDTLFLKSDIQSAVPNSGRMSPLTAACFIFIGLGIFLTSVKSLRSYRLAATGLLACCAGVVSGMAIFGYLTGIETAYGWGAYSRMAITTAGLLEILSLGLLIWAWQTARVEKISFVRWVPVTGAATLMGMMAFVAAVNMNELGVASHWRKHTFDVILDAQAFEENLIDLQRGLRGYVTMGDTNALFAYHNSRQLEGSQFNEITELTSENAGQQLRLKDLAVAITNLFAYDEQSILLYDQKGAQAVFNADLTGRGRIAFGNANAALKTFTGEEKRLLNVRDATETTEYHNATKLLIFGSAMAALLLIIAHFMASRELRHRHRIEGKLRETTTLQNAILNSASYAIIALEPNGIIRSFNHAAERMLGYAAPEVVGKVTPTLWRDPAELIVEAKQMSEDLGEPILPGVDVITKKTFVSEVKEYEATYIHKNGHRFPVLVSLTALAEASGKISGFLGIIADITERKERESEREKLISELQTALAEIKTLSGMIPICGWCKNVRADEGYWQSVEQYVHAHTQATFSHGMCPDCTEKFKTDIANASRP